MTLVPEPVQKTRALYRVVKYTFYRLDPAWRRLSDNDRRSTKDNFLATLRKYNALVPRTNSLIGTRGDADFVLWLITDSMEDLQSFNSEVLKTDLGKFLTTPYSYMVMIRPSEYFSKTTDPEPVGSNYCLIFGEGRLSILDAKVLASSDRFHQVSPGYHSENPVAISYN